MTVPKLFLEKKLMSTGEVARRMNVHRGTVWHWIQTGMLRAERVTERYWGVSAKAVSALRKTYSQEVDSAQKSVSPKKLRTSSTDVKTTGTRKRRKE